MKQDTNGRNYTESWFVCLYIPSSVLLLCQAVLYLIMKSLFSVISLPISFSLSLLTIIGEWSVIMFHKYKVALLQITLVTIVFSICTVWPLSEDTVPLLLNGNPPPFYFLATWLCLSGVLEYFVNDLPHHISSLISELCTALEKYLSEEGSVNCGWWHNWTIILDWIRKWDATAMRSKPMSNIPP